MILQGDLRDFSLPDVLQLLMQQRKTGVLSLTRGKEQSELFISQGNIIGVRVAGRTPESKMQEMLIESGRVNQKDMAELEVVSRDMGRPLLSTLSAKGLLTDDQRESWFQMAAEDMVCDLFSWTEGQYSFSTTQKSLPHALGSMRLSTEFACMEGMRRVDEWPRLKESLPFEGAVFQATGSPPADELGEWEAMVLGSVDGIRSLVHIGRLVPFGTFRLYECILNLWKTGCLAPVDAASAQGGETQAIAPQAERDQKTALVIGVAAVCLVCALLVRLGGLWVIQQGDAPLRKAETRVQADIGRRNAEVFLLEEASEHGAYPEDLRALVRRGMLTVPEAYGPSGAKLLYSKRGSADFELK